MKEMQGGTLISGLVWSFQAQKLHNDLHVDNPSVPEVVSQLTSPYIELERA